MTQRPSLAKSLLVITLGLCCVAGLLWFLFWLLTKPVPIGISGGGSTG